MDQDDEAPTPREKTAVAEDIDRLQQTVKRLASEREVLPQPLFWSLFHTRLEAIRKHKTLARAVREAFGETEG